MTEDKELTTMTTIAEALDEIDDEAIRARVLQWINSRYGKAKGIPSFAGAGGQHEDGEEGAFTDLAALFTAAGPTTDPERVLVAGYWFQAYERNENLDAQVVNTALKQLGHQLSNITSTFSSLKARKPALVIQVQKKGKTKQARKKYRLTNAGLQTVRHMLSS